MDEDSPLQRMLSARTEEEFEQARAENDAAPREPGRFKVTLGGPPRAIEPHDRTCEDCGRQLHSKGGLAFASFPCSLHQCDFTDCDIVHIHWSQDCPAWRHRWWRFVNIKTWGEVTRRYRSWKWRRRQRQERQDVRRWLDYWTKGGR